MNSARSIFRFFGIGTAAVAALFGVALAPAPLSAQNGWQPQTLPALPDGSLYAITAVSALSPNDVWITGAIKPGSDTFVARTTNGGSQWQVVHRSVIGGISRLKALSNDVAFIGGPNLFRSTLDGGATWVQEQGNLPVPPGNWHNIGPSGHVYGLAVVDGTHIWTAGYDGAIAGVIFHRKPERPQDPQNVNTNAPWWLEWAQSYRGMYGIAAVNNQVAWAVGAAGYIWKTIDGGDGWGQQTSNTGVALNDVAALDADTAWVVGDGGLILKTIDGGTAWQVQGSGTVESLRRIAAVDADVAWVVGTNGIILRTTDGGASWRAQVSGTVETLSGVAAANATTAWVVGDGVLLATTDGGTYQPLSAPGVGGVDPAGGPTAGGTAAVSVYGRDFRPGARVYFGGVPAAVTEYRTSGNLMVTTPAHAAGIVDVTVVNPDGQSATGAKAFAFADTGPLIVRLSPSYGYVNAQAELYISGAGLTPAKGTYEPVPKVNINGTEVPGGYADYDRMYVAFASSLLTQTGVTDITVTTAAGTSNPLRFAVNPAGAAVQKPSTPPYDSTVSVPSLSGPVQATFHGLNRSGSVWAGIALDDPQWIVDNSPAPPGYRFLPAYYYQVSIDPSSSLHYQAATLCFPYSDSDLAAAGVDESRLRLMRFFYNPDNSHAWEDVTVTLDTAANQICGTSPEPMIHFALAQGPQQTPPPAIKSIVPALSPPGGGAAVTINGSRFPADATVTFGGAAATNVTVLNGIKITAQIPPHALGLVDVAVGSPGGPSGVLTDGFEYVGPPALTSLTPQSGHDGTEVTITGAGFRDGCTVTFGGQTTGAAVVTDTTITAYAPSHAPGLVDVTVTNVDGQSGTLAKAFTYVPAPAVAYVEPNAGPVEGGTAVTITGTGFQDGAAVTFGYTEATGVVVVNPTTITALTPASSEGMVDVYVFNPDGQSANSGFYGGFTYGKSPSLITWANPASIPYGTKLSAAQLNATANVEGTFSYSPAAGSTPQVGTRTLTAYFTPTDTETYPYAKKSVSLLVLPARGDVNADGAVNVGDAIVVLQVLSARTPGTADVGADADGDGAIGLADAVFIFQKAAGMRQE